LKAVWLASAGSIALIGIHAPAHAQSGTTHGQNPDSATADSAASQTSIAEIVVTAQRRPERLQNVPVSVTAIGADTLKERGLNEATQLTIATPSLQIGQESSFSIRGIGTLAFSTTIDSSVAMAIDDVNIGRPLAGGNAFLDVAQVEVLNGPQGLLFGKNASAGLINITTVRPRIGITETLFDLEADARPGGSEGVIARATVNLPVSANSALRVSGIYNYQDSLTDHVSGDVPARYEDSNRQFGIRGKYLFEATDNLSIYLIGEYNEQHGLSGFADGTYRSLGLNSVNTPFLPTTNYEPGPKNLTAVSNAPGFRDLKNGGAQASISYVTSGGVEVSDIAAWRFYDFDQQNDGDITLGDGLDLNRSGSKYNQYTNEFRVALPADSRLTGQAGLYLFHSTLDGTTNRAGSNFFPAFLLPSFPFCVGATPAAGGPPNCSINNDYFLGTDKFYNLKTTSYAGFGQFTYQLFESFKIIAGARVTRDEIEIDLTQNQLNYFVPFGARGVFNQSYGNTNLSWRAGAQYNPTEAIMVYGTFARGYKGPGFNDTPATANADLTIKPETSDSFEIGLKSTWLNHKLTFNVTAFHNTLHNYQAQAFDTDIRTFLVKNAASVKNKGVEVSFVARPIPQLTINGSTTFLDSKFESFAGAQCYPGQPDPSCNVDNTFDAGGLRTPSSPKFSATMSATFEQPVSDGLSFVADVNYYHRSSINYLINGAPGATVSPIDILGGSIGFRGSNWTVAVFCKNCTNKIFPNYIGLESGDASAGIASYVQTLGYNSVRTIGARLNFNF
jgi:iron complex outermembrane receptor protein